MTANHLVASGAMGQQVVGPEAGREHADIGILWRRNLKNSCNLIKSISIAIAIIYLRDIRSPQF